MPKHAFKHSSAVKRHGGDYVYGSYCNIYIRKLFHYVCRYKSAFIHAIAPKPAEQAEKRPCGRNEQFIEYVWALARYRCAKPRAVLISRQQWLEMQMNQPDE